MELLILVVSLILAFASLKLEKTVPAIIAFVVMMFLLGIYYILLGEKLLGLFQIFVYTGGIVVLALFGVTVIGTKFPNEAERPWAILSIVIITIGLFIVPFLLPEMQTKPLGDQVKVFTENYAEVTIFLALVGASILYAAIRMLHTLKKDK